MKPDRSRAVSTRPTLGRRQRVLLLDSQPDHSELVRRAVHDVLPDAEIEVSTGDSPSRPRAESVPDLVLVSVGVDERSALALLERIAPARAPRPPVLLLDGPEGRWSEAARSAVAAAATLDKRNGATFLDGLRATVERLAGRGTHAARAGASPPAAPVAPCNVGIVAALLEVDPDGTVCCVERLAGHPAAAAGRPLAAGVPLASLVGLELGQIPPGVLVPLPGSPDLAACRLPVPLAGPATGRAAVLVVGRTARSGATPTSVSALRARLVEGAMGDAVARIASLAGSMHDELESARLAAGEERPSVLDAACGRLDELCAEAERVCRTLGPAGAPRRRRLGARLLVSLREPVWRRWSRQVRLTTHIEPRLPFVNVAPEILGPWIDGVVSSLAEWAGEEGALSVELNRSPPRPGDPLDDPCAVERDRVVHLELAARRTGTPLTDAQGRVAGDDWLSLGALVAGWHGGTFVWSESEDRTGRHAVLTLLSVPRRELPSPAGDRPPAILVVDDDAEVRRVVAGLLESLDCRPIVAESGEDAIALVAAGCRYDLVLLDMMMPGIDGAGTLERLLRTDPSARVVFCSGSPGAEGLRRGLAAGAIGYVEKPVRLGALAELVGMASARPLGPAPPLSESSPRRAPR